MNKAEAKKLGASGGRAVKRTLGKEWFKALALYQHKKITKSELRRRLVQIKAKHAKRS